MLSFAEEIVVALVKHRVEFVVVGGVSAVLQGVPIVTQDIDICYRRTGENCDRVAAALKAFSPKLRDLPEGLPNFFDESTLRLGSNFTLVARGQALDLLGIMSGIGGYEEIIASAEAMEVAGVVVHVLALEDLIKTKRAAGRPKDLAVLPLLEATLEMQRGGKK